MWGRGLGASARRKETPLPPGALPRLGQTRRGQIIKHTIDTSFFAPRSRQGILWLLCVVEGVCVRCCCCVLCVVTTSTATLTRQGGTMALKMAVLLVAVAVAAASVCATATATATATAGRFVVPPASKTSVPRTSRLARLCAVRARACVCVCV